MKKIILASTSTLKGEAYLAYLLPVLKSHFKACENLIFIPYAQPSGISYDDYTAKVVTAFAKINLTIKGIHEFENPMDALESADGVFTGGGNTFVLLSKLYELQLMAILTKKINAGMPYLGTSAGSNICGLNIQTTNDMPIVYPPSFMALGLIPFNLNPHFVSENELIYWVGESRETRIKEFHAFHSTSVLGLREGSWLEIYGNKITLKGNLKAVLFKANQLPKEIETGSDLSDLE